MAFIRSGSIDGAQDPFENGYLLTDGEGAVLGEALVQTNGRLTKCGPTVTPEFISACARVAEATSIKPLPVVRTKEDTEYTVASTATVPTTLIGAKVTIDATGLLVTATATSGVFEISATDGVATASTVKGYFRR
jgi:hypothetical protein